jgi:hypothetical protein
MKFWLGVLATLLVLQPGEVASNTHYDVLIQEVPYVYDPDATPILNSMVDWEEQERQEECLWVMIQELGLDVTGRNVFAAGEWADINGGACLLIGEDDASRSLEQVKP